jgi:hypothetical protein
VAEKKKAEPAQAQEIAAAGEAAMEEVLTQSTVDALMKATPADLVKANPEAEVRKNTEKRSTAWMHAPGNLELLTVAGKRLTRVAKWMGWSAKQVTHLQAEVLKGTRILIIKPAPETDRTAYEIKRYGSEFSGWANIWPLLAEAGLTVESGYKEKYEVNYIPQGSALWPGLVIDMGQRKERRAESHKKEAKQ